MRGATPQTSASRGSDGGGDDVVGGGVGSSSKRIEHGFGDEK